ncbi:PIG-L family deacetylase [Bradyrhizobium sp.]|uniref:PIG-L family deacetylase n=1 Tax=Bradyrhizobium sp. TaxID=376 RepID=UPI001DD254A7|nr:PIG-L family deacetylase [Bradyrhizobium sp.]MBI5318273.1 PIG-L family deacetylase [Bradyrhizobium sp.]
MFRTAASALLATALLGAAPASAAETARPDKVSFYFAAHQDDWQLFMNPSAFQDVIGAAARTVFVHITAGDAGLGTSTGDRKHPLYLARDNGAEQAVRFMADTEAVPDKGTASTVSLNGHPIYRVGYRNTVSYFLRVPDGSPLGTGYAHTGFQSLKRLADGDNDTLAAVDGSTAYHGWNDLTATLRAIIDYERGQARLVQLNVAELDPQINPGDHSDHLMTAKAAIAAARDLPCVRLVSYVNYASSKLPENLDLHERDMESSVFAVTLAGVQALGQPTSWRHYDRSYVGRNYFRVQAEPGNCSLPATEIAARRRTR